MPQMAPMNWFILFITFGFIFITSINKIFYLSINNFNFYQNKKSSSSSSLNLWKW